MRRYRVLAAFVLAPLTPTAMAILLVACQAQIVGRAAPFGDLLRFLMFNAAIGYPVAAVAGVPVYMTTRGTAFSHWAFYAGTGAILGFIAAKVFGPGSEGIAPTSMQLAAIVFGSASVFAFWLIARPDQYRRGA